MAGAIPHRTGSLFHRMGKIIEEEVFLMDKRCQCELPYPPVEVTCPNSAWLPPLKELYAGRRSELGAITQYCYQSFILSRRREELSKLLRSIAIVEMHHLEMLGKLICLCGGTPDFAGKSRNWWSGSFLNYRKDPCGALLVSLSDEVAAVDAYRNAADRIRDPKIQEVLRRIAMDEALHVQTLREEIDRCRCATGVSPYTAASRPNAVQKSK